MTTINEIQKMTPNEVWEVYVGSQSVAEFMKHSATNDLEQAALSYVNDPIWRRDMMVDDDVAAQAIAQKLAAHIRRLEKEEKERCERRLNLKKASIS